MTSSKHGSIALLVTFLTLWGAPFSPQAGEQDEYLNHLVILNQPVPRLTGTRADWLNTNGKVVPFVPGQVYIVHFWAFGCGNCKRNLPAYEKWYKKYKSMQVQMIGVHTPETEKERKVSNLQDAIRKHGIEYPVLIDSDSSNWKRWKQQWWPTVYLIDKWGRVRYYWMGELEWENAGGTQIMEHFLNVLLQEPWFGGYVEQTIPDPQEQQAPSSHSSGKAHSGTQ